MTNSGNREVMRAMREERKRRFKKRSEVERQGDPEPAEGGPEDGRQEADDDEHLPPVQYAPAGVGQPPDGRRMDAAGAS